MSAARAAATARAAANAPQPWAPPPSVTIIDDWMPYRFHKAATVLGDTLLAYYSERHGLSRSGWKTLAVLVGKPGLSAAEIVRATGYEPYSISRAIGQLRKQGLIDRRTSSHDKRYISVCLTARGEHVFADIWRLAQRLEEAMFASLTPAQQAELGTIVAHLEATGAEVAERGWRAFIDDSTAPDHAPDGQTDDGGEPRRRAALSGDKEHTP